MPSIYRLFISSFSVVLLGTFCAFVSHLILARLLPVAEYGVFSFIVSSCLFLSIFSLFGFQNALVRFIPALHNQGNEKGQITRLIRFSKKFTLGLSMASAIFVFALFYVFGLSEKYPILSFVIGVILVPLMVYIRLQAAVLRGHQKAALSVFVETTLREFLFLVIVLGFLLWGGVLASGVQALIFLSISLIIAIGFGVWKLRPLLKQAGRGVQNEAGQKKEWLGVAFPMMLVIVAQRLMRRSDIIIIGVMLNPIMVGIYAIAAQFSEVSAISQKVVQSVFSSRASDYYTQNKILELKRLYLQNLIFSSCSTAALCAIIVVLFPYILHFIGDEYLSAFNALVILLAGHFLMVCVGPAAALLAMTSYEKTVMWVTLAAAMGNIALNIPMIYFYGLEGAAITTAFFIVFRNVLSLVFVLHYNILKIPTGEEVSKS